MFLILMLPVIDIVRELEEYKIPVVILMHMLTMKVYKEYGIKLNTYKELQDLMLLF